MTTPINDLNRFLTGLERNLPTTLLSPNAKLHTVEGEMKVKTVIAKLTTLTRQAAAELKLAPDTVKRLQTVTEYLSSLLDATGDSFVTSDKSPSAIQSRRVSLDKMINGLFDKRVAPQASYQNNQLSVAKKEEEKDIRFSRAKDGSVTVQVKETDLPATKAEKRFKQTVSDMGRLGKTPEQIEEQQSALVTFARNLAVPVQKEMINDLYQQLPEDQKKPNASHEDQIATLATFYGVKTVTAENVIGHRLFLSSSATTAITVHQEFGQALTFPILKNVEPKLSLGENGRPQFTFSLETTAKRDRQGVDTHTAVIEVVIDPIGNTLNSSCKVTPAKK